MDETFAGAENRARALAQRNAQEALATHYCVGIEGGVVHLHGRWFAFGVICIAERRDDWGSASHRTSSCRATSRPGWRGGPNSAT